MPDAEIRDRLERLGDRVEVAPDAFERLVRRRVRVERRRRVATAVLAFVIAIGGTVGLVTAFRGERVSDAGSATPSVETKSRVYRDPLGWELEVPEGWHVLRAKWFDGRKAIAATVIGTAVLKPSPADLEGKQPDLSGFGPNDVGLVVWRFEGGPTLATHPDSSFPLRWGAFKTIPRPFFFSGGQDFWLSGRRFRLERAILVSVLPERLYLLRRTIASLRPIGPPGDDFALLAGTKWTLLQIDGVAVSEMTSQDGVESLEFTDRRLGGFNGCNVFGGRYWIEGDRLHVRGVAETLVLCTGDIGSREDSFDSRLFAGGKLSLDGDILTLVSQEGTLTFRRA